MLHVLVQRHPAVVRMRRAVPGRHRSRGVAVRTEPRIAAGVQSLSVAKAHTRRGTSV